MHLHACITHLLSRFYVNNGECSLAVLFTVFSVELTYLDILIMFGRGGVYADEEHRDKTEK
jgi:hypothetical protein